MERNALFRALGRGAKFDVQRFEEDARRFKVFKSTCSSDPTWDDPWWRENDAAEKVANRIVGKRALEGKSGEPAVGNTDDDEEEVEEEEEEEMGIVMMTDRGRGFMERRLKKKKKILTAEVKAAKAEATRKQTVAMTRRALHVRVKGCDVPDPVLTFETLGETFNLSEQLLKNVASLGFKRPSPVQAQSLPAMLKGLEVLVAAPTGTGKTLAFCLPIVHHLAKDKKKYKRLRAVLLSPTRELTSQVRILLSSLLSCQHTAKYCGLLPTAPPTPTSHPFMIPVLHAAHDPFFPSFFPCHFVLLLLQTRIMIENIAEGLRLSVYLLHSAQCPPEKGRCDILVSTPQLLVNLLQRKPPAVNLSRVQWLVLDEADKLFEGDDNVVGNTAKGDNEEEESGKLRRDGEGDQVDTNGKRAAAGGVGQKEEGRKSFAENATNLVAENKDEPSGDGLPRDEDEMQSAWSNSKHNECGKERRNERQRASFAEQLSMVMAACTESGVQPQKALFSATLTAKVDNWVKENLTNPIRIMVGTKNTPSLRVHQELLFVGGEDGKRVAMRQLLTQNMTPPILIFVQSVERAKQLAHELEFDGLRVGQLHGQQTHTQRRDSLLSFRSGNIWLLICTDLAARGLDLPATRLVINYDLPTTSAAYVHRVGRTGRAGNSGKAVTFFTEDDRPLLRSLAETMHRAGAPVPDYLLALEKLSRRETKKVIKRPPRREPISVHFEVHRGEAQKADEPPPVNTERVEQRKSLKTVKKRKRMKLQKPAENENAD
uniref:probable ATP-dependent RNA helicase DDX52 n=1 Tax=Myxine glutinosa TaxID=7769 RepID=UPI00358F2352